MFPASTRPTVDWSRLFSLLALISGGSVSLWAWAQNKLLLYGDATAHLMISRRMVDSATPGIAQWGSVWLPFPHLLNAIFILIPGFWKTGAAGALVSVAMFSLSTGSLYRLVRRSFFPDREAEVAAAWAAGLYLLNPCLLYLSAVPMTESVYLACFLGAIDNISAAVLKSRAAENACIRGDVARASLWALAGSMCRYDGWFVLPFYALSLLLIRGRAMGAKKGLWGFKNVRSAFYFCCISGVGPLFWFAYNAFYFKDWLAFARGPYSARQIYLRALRHGGQPYPGDHNLKLAFIYYVKTAALNTGMPLLLLALAGLLLWLWREARRRPLDVSRWLPLLLVLPLPWYLWAMWGGNVPIFIPQYWPHGYYNVRYGAQLLPAACAFSAFLVVALAASLRVWPHQLRPRLERVGGLAGRALRGLAESLRQATPRSITAGVVIAAGLFCLTAYAEMLGGDGPITYAEAVHNAPDRLAVEHQLALALRQVKWNQRVLIYLGSYPGALADDGIPIRHTIQESNFRLWDAALKQPQNYVQWVVVQAGSWLDNDVNHAAVEKYFRRTAVIDVPTQPVLRVYKLRRN